jgi:hypothetical protein
MNDDVDTTDQPTLLAREFVEFWFKRHQAMARKDVHDVCFDGFMAGATCVLHYFLGETAPTVPEATQILALLATETGRHMNRLTSGDD